MYLFGGMQSVGEVMQEVVPIKYLISQQQELHQHPIHQSYQGRHLPRNHRCAKGWSIRKHIEDYLIILRHLLLCEDKRMTMGVNIIKRIILPHK